MENRIKEPQLNLFADRTSCTKWWANQYRVLLAALAYTLLETMRRTVLRGTALARAQCRTIRLRLLKTGAVVTRNTRTVAVRLSSACPDEAVSGSWCTDSPLDSPLRAGGRENTRPRVHPGPSPYAR